MRTIDPSCNAAGISLKHGEKTSCSCCAARQHLLFNDPDRLKGKYFYTTIVKSYKFDRTCKTTFEVMPGTIKQYLTTEEAALFCPLLEINRIALA